MSNALTTYQHDLGPFVWYIQCVVCETFIWLFCVCIDRSVMGQAGITVTTISAEKYSRGWPALGWIYKMQLLITPNLVDRRLCLLVAQMCRVPDYIE